MEGDKIEFLCNVFASLWHLQMHSNLVLSGLSRFRMKVFSGAFVPFSVVSMRKDCRSKEPPPWLTGLGGVPLEEGVLRAAITASSEEVMTLSKPTYLNSVKTEGPAPRPPLHPGAGCTDPTWCIGWDERAFLVTHSGSSLETPRLAGCHSRSCG